MRAQHTLINGLSVGTGGTYTVARELTRHLAIARPEWMFTIALISGHPLHEEFRAEALPHNVKVLWAPESATNRVRRAHYENTSLVAWARQESIASLVQLNGMLIRRMVVPTLAHNQDPMPYRPVAWPGQAYRLVALMKRREHARALRLAEAVGFTSSYLRTLLCDRLGVTPKQGEVFYNGLPQTWFDRARRSFNSWDLRSLEIVTVSNVEVYKRQSLVIVALSKLIKLPRLERLTYRIIGECAPAYKKQLMDLAQSLGLADRVIIEGRVSASRVQQALTSAKCFVLMSVCESFGIPSLEAMSCGAPVLTADCCAMPEICGPAAVRCPPDDVDAVVSGVQRILIEPGYAERLRQLGSQQVQKFRWRDTAERVAARLEDMVRQTAYTARLG